jgi:hypothetical protein
MMKYMNSIFPLCYLSMMQNKSLIFPLGTDMLEGGREREIERNYLLFRNLNVLKDETI